MPHTGSPFIHHTRLTHDAPRVQTASLTLPQARPGAAPGSLVRRRHKHLTSLLRFHPFMHFTPTVTEVVRGKRRVISKRK